MRPGGTDREAAGRIGSVPECAGGRRACSGGDRTTKPGRPPARAEHVIAGRKPRRDSVLSRLRGRETAANPPPLGTSETVATIPVFLSLAPKGRPQISPGQRPGFVSVGKTPSPERATHRRAVVPPFQGSRTVGHRGPRALHWADLSGPFGARFSDPASLLSTLISCPSNAPPLRGRIGSAYFSITRDKRSKYKCTHTSAPGRQ